MPVFHFLFVFAVTLPSCLVPLSVCPSEFSADARLLGYLANFLMVSQDSQETSALQVWMPYKVPIVMMGVVVLVAEG